MKSIAVLIVLGLIFMGCQPKSNFDKVAIEQEVREMLLAYDDSVRANGIEGEFYFLDNSDEFYWVPPGYKYALDYDSIANILRTYAPQFKKVDNSWETLRIMPLSEKYASFNGLVVSTTITYNNDTTITKLSETGLVVKRGKQWKLLSGQTNTMNGE